MSEEEKLQLENEYLMKYSKAQMIQKYIDELEESSKLSELWCKSQQENKQLKDNWNKIEQIIENERMSHWAPSPLFLTELLSKMEELEKGDSNE